jgi:hypothetical protein
MRKSKIHHRNIVVRTLYSVKVAVTLGYIAAALASLAPALKLSPCLNTPIIAPTAVFNELKKK